MSVELLKVSVVGFRACREHAVLRFQPAGKMPGFTVIYGENGTGKSTFVDAIELALQGKLHREAHLDRDETPIAISVGLKEASIQIDLSDDTSVFQTVSEGVTRKGLLRASLLRAEPIPGFTEGPFVIRRIDITGLVDCSPRERGIYLLPFFAELKASATRRPLNRTHQTEHRQMIWLRDLLRAELDELGIPRPKNADEATEMLSRLDKETSGGIKIAQLASLERRLAEPWWIERRRDVVLMEPRYEEILKRYAGFLTDIQDRVWQSFLDITRWNQAHKLTLDFESSRPSSLRLNFHFMDGSYADAARVLSEGQRDLLSLLLYFELVRQASKLGQAKVMVLDDVLHSIDAQYRVTVLEFLAKSFRDWQILLVTHDHPWSVEASEILRLEGVLADHIEFRSWSPSTGPLIDYRSGRVGSVLLRARGTLDASTIAGSAGILLELCLDKASVIFSTQITRKPNDNYNIGDLWDAVSKALAGTNLEPQFGRLASMKFLRNFLGAHWSAYSLTVSKDVAGEFADRVVAIFEGLHCPTCQTWVRRRGVSWSCRCGSTRVSK
jgi:ABC-type Mn2+/Zn2+ transport system ATPase subunit